MRSKSHCNSFILNHSRLLTLERPIFPSEDSFLSGFQNWDTEEIFTHFDLFFFKSSKRYKKVTLKNKKNHPIVIFLLPVMITNHHLTMFTFKPIVLYDYQMHLKCNSSHTCYALFVYYIYYCSIPLVDTPQISDLIDLLDLRSVNENMATRAEVCRWLLLRSSQK